MTAMAAVEARAMDRGLSLAPATAADVLGVRGVYETGGEQEDSTALAKVLLAEFDAVLSAFVEMREQEGRALGAVMGAQLDEIDRLTEAAALAAADRRPQTEAAFRVAQELALLAVKLDVTEEIDRLRAHVAAARDLIAKGSPVGRKLDFLMQEFNREANTLCSKAQNGGLTSIGLELKTVIEQMREQVQNVE